MKKIFSLMLAAVMMLSSAAFAADDIEVTVNGTVIEDNLNDTYSSQNTESNKSNQVIVNVNVNQQPYTIDSFARLELYSKSGEFLDYDELWVGGITQELVYIFDVPEYSLGESFILKVAGGITSVKYYDSVYYPGQQFEFPTYSYIDDTGTIINNNSIAVDAVPCHNRPINFYYDGVYVDIQPGARIIDGTAMVPIDSLAKYIGLSTYYDSDYNSQVVAMGNKEMYFNLGSTYTTLFDKSIDAPVAAQFIDGAVFVALRPFADALGSELEVYNNLTYFDINMHASKMVNDYFNELLVNQNGISSRTNHLVWVSLNEFKVRVYEGKQYQWKPIRECVVGIGAPGTPTITGEFEYQYKDRWNYASYYVGPCLVFYGGYALHSVLLNYDGTEYDGTVGAKVSHGCIRMKKADIDWLASTIGIGTKIYITP